MVNDNKQSDVTRTFKRFKGLILESPWGKTLFLVIIPIISGILSGIFVTEITVSNKISWPLIYKAKSFYGIIFLMVLMSFYYRALFLQDIEIIRFSDYEYRKAYMWSQCLPQLSENYKSQIKAGSSQDFLQMMSDFKRMIEE